MTDSSSLKPTRDFTATAFVVWQGKVLLHKHKKLGEWFPCGGHIEKDELPDEAAVREVAESAGVKLGAVAQPLRAALTGKRTSPGIYDVLFLLGRDESLSRIADQMTASPGN